MNKTPNEIKKGLECCTVPLCAECPYDNEPSCVAKNADALALIQQLESRNNTLYHTILGVMHFVDKWLDVPAYDPDKDANGSDAVARASQAREVALKAIEQLEAERDAAVNALRQQGCAFCVHRDNESWEAPCRYCCDSGHWQWRGVQKEE